MLRIWLASGEELAPVSKEKIRVWDLKRHLRTEHSMPFSLQRLICGGACLEDDDHVTAPCELQLVLSSVVSARQKRNSGEELVRFAADRGCAEVARHLLQAGADKDYYSITGLHDGGRTALARAATRGYIELVRLLIDAGARTDTLDEHALIYAASKGHTEIARVLVDAGADKDVLVWGRTALMHAAWKLGFGVPYFTTFFLKESL